MDLDLVPAHQEAYFDLDRGLTLVYSRWRVVPDFTLFTVDPALLNGNEQYTRSF